MSCFSSLSLGSDIHFSPFIGDEHPGFDGRCGAAEPPRAGGGSPDPPSVRKAAYGAAWADCPYASSGSRADFWRRRALSARMDDGSMHDGRATRDRPTHRSHHCCMRSRSRRAAGSIDATRAHDRIGVARAHHEAKPRQRHKHETHRTLLRFEESKCREPAPAPATPRPGHRAASRRSQRRDGGDRRQCLGARDPIWHGAASLPRFS